MALALAAAGPLVLSSRHFTPPRQRFVAAASPRVAAIGTVGSSTPENAVQMTPLIAVHMSAALGAVALGPVALWARQRGRSRPRLHRAFGYAWVTLMIAAAVSAVFIRDFTLPNIAGYTPIHLLVPVTLGMLATSFYKLAQGNVNAHRLLMRGLYVGGCVVAGGFTLLPNRYLGKLVLGQWLGLA